MWESVCAHEWGPIEETKGWSEPNWVGQCIPIIYWERTCRKCGHKKWQWIRDPGRISMWADDLKEKEGEQWNQL